ncbi:LmeA family phospholipid-binding protein [Mycobacterium sp. NPDC003323]
MPPTPPGPQPPEQPRDPATRRIPRPPRPDLPTQRIPHAEPPTQQIRRPEPPTDKMRVPDPATRKIPVPPPPPIPPPPLQTLPPGPQEPEPKATRNRQSIVLIAVIVVAALIGTLAGAELFARHRAGTVLSGITDCLVEDTADVSYSVTPPFLWQYLTDHYTDISVITTGDRVQAAKGMTADVTLSDIELRDSGDSAGTIGSVQATLSWTADGIKQTVAENLPVVGDLVTSVRTDASAGTLILDATGDTSITAEPEVRDGNLELVVQEVTGAFDQATVQTALDELTTQLNENYPLGIKADSVTVTDTGVDGTFSSTDATIPTGESDPCFADL